MHQTKITPPQIGKKIEKPLFEISLSNSNYRTRFAPTYLLYEQSELSD